MQFPDVSLSFLHAFKTSKYYHSTFHTALSELKKKCDSTMFTAIDVYICYVL